MPQLTADRLLAALAALAERQARHMIDRIDDPDPVVRRHGRPDVRDAAPAVFTDPACADPRGR